MDIRREFTGMLPGAIVVFENLFTTAKAAGLSPVIESGYNSAAGRKSFFGWGCACRMTANDLPALQTLAKTLGITWLSNDGEMAYTGGRTIKDFETFRVNGDLKLVAPAAPEEEVI